MMDDRRRLWAKREALGDQACAPIAILSGCLSVRLVEGNRLEHSPRAGEVVRRCERLGGRRGAGDHFGRRGERSGGVERSTPNCVGSRANRGPELLDPVGFGQAVVIREAQRLATSFPSTGVACSGRSGTLFAHELGSPMSRHDAGDLLGGDRAVVHDDDFHAVGEGLPIERREAAFKDVGPIPGRHDDRDGRSPGSLHHRPQASGG
jgi:hypothetical protein